MTKSNFCCDDGFEAVRLLRNVINLFFMTHFALFFTNSDDL